MATKSCACGCRPWRNRDGTLKAGASCVGKLDRGPKLATPHRNICRRCGSRLTLRAQQAGEGRCIDRGKCLERACARALPKSAPWNEDRIAAEYAAIVGHPLEPIPESDPGYRQMAYAPAAGKKPNRTLVLGLGSILPPVEVEAVEELLAA